MLSNHIYPEPVDPDFICLPPFFLFNVSPPTTRRFESTCWTAGLGLSPLLDRSLSLTYFSPLTRSIAVGLSLSIILSSSPVLSKAVSWSCNYLAGSTVKTWLTVPLDTYKMSQLFLHVYCAAQARYNIIYS